jgi:polyphosphate kinase 2 (PPK2 family)
MVKMADTKILITDDRYDPSRAVSNSQPQRVQSAAKSLRLRSDCDYEKELRLLQAELVKLQEWARHKELQMVLIFEGRDGAGKGGPPIEDQIFVRRYYR